ncbi:50S ribosomal protein L15 [Candidatus Parcubacteria bacterium]|nr:50S ribosomal protein L15 [Candidatus Parcubacteria bacterium]
MQIHNIKRKTKNKTQASVGRGGKRGKTSGRGTKGQKARAGGKLRPEVRDFIKRIPKMRGRGKSSNKSIYAKSVSVNLGVIDKIFSNGDSVTPATLTQKGLITTHRGVRPFVKILAGGEITKKLSVSGCFVSVSAKALIEKAGGNVLDGSKAKEIVAK